MIKRFLPRYESARFKEVLDDVERYGPDHRLPLGMTSLMAAAYAMNAPLCAALLERGASRESRDHAGRLPMHYVLRRLLEDTDPLRMAGPVWDLVAPPSFDVEVDGHLVQLGREQGEYFVFSLMLAWLSWMQIDTFGRYFAYSAGEISEMNLARLPDAILAPERRRREYISHVLTRAEANSTYRPARRLWIRERHGHYMPNPALRLRVRLHDGSEEWQPLLQVVNAPWYDSFLSPMARGRLDTLPLPGPLIAPAAKPRGRGRKAAAATAHPTGVPPSPGDGGDS